VDTPEVKARNLALNQALSQAGQALFQPGLNLFATMHFASRTNEHDATLFPCNDREPLHFG
jgi:hypothetical protein